MHVCASPPFSPQFARNENPSRSMNYAARSPRKHLPPRNESCSVRRPRNHQLIPSCIHPGNLMSTDQARPHSLSTAPDQPQCTRLHINTDPTVVPLLQRPRMPWGWASHLYPWKICAQKQKNQDRHRMSLRPPSLSFRPPSPSIQLPALSSGAAM